MSFARLVTVFSLCSVALLSACEGQETCGDEVCPTGQACELGACRSPCPCGPGLACVEGLCYPTACGDVACQAGEVCLDGECGAPACGGESCAPLRCDPAKGNCVACTEDAHCGGATPQCNTATGQCECAAGASEVCNNQDDDDCDGLLDCSDPDCTGKVCGLSGASCQGDTCVCPGGEAREQTCSDGEDNDCDGLIDCGDPDCAQQTCRAAVGVCDAAEVCTAGVCPADQLLPSTEVCRPGEPGTCDVAELCTGTSAACPDDGVAQQGAVCRQADGECDQTEVCDGTSRACPPDGVKEQGNACGNAPEGTCDLQDVCDGSSKTCTQQVAAAGTVCRAKEGACDTAEVCNGASAECPADRVLPSDAECRAPEPGTACGLAEYCTGTSKECPENGHAVGTVCRPAEGVCDTADVCDGRQAECPADQVKPATEVCRPATDLCDADDFCTGTSKACGADGVQPAGTSCRAANPALGCDAADSCNGVHKVCGDSALAPGVLCRPAAGACDTEERCTGGSVACPPDAFVAEGTRCSYDNNPCTTDQCNGQGACGAQPAGDGTGCAGGQCCGLACVDLNTDWQNCGGCGQVCTGDQICCNGRCDSFCF